MLFNFSPIIYKHITEEYQEEKLLYHQKYHCLSLRSLLKTDLCSCENFQRPRKEGGFITGLRVWVPVSCCDKSCRKACVAPKKELAAAPTRVAGAADFSAPRKAPPFCQEHPPAPLMIN